MINLIFISNGINMVLLRHIKKISTSFVIYVFKHIIKIQFLF